MVLSRKERSKINKANRAKGYRVEYDTVQLFKSLGWWAKRLPSREQKGKWSPVDGFFWNPDKRMFGYFQSKVRKALLTTSEIQNLCLLAQEYKCDIIFSWRDWGIKWEYLVNQIS